jgi:hypothetical protein
MKRSFLLVLVFSFLAFPLSSCQEAALSFDNSLPQEVVSVSVDYGAVELGRATVQLSPEIDLASTEVRDKSEPNHVVKEFIGADMIEVYFTSSAHQAIDHALVRMAGLIEVSAAVTPGSGEMALFSSQDGDETIIGDQGIHCVINRDGTFADLQTLDTSAHFYGAYNSDAVICHSLNGAEAKTVPLSALYSYCPR